MVCAVDWICLSPVSRRFRHVYAWSHPPAPVAGFTGAMTEERMPRPGWLRLTSPPLMLSLSLNEGEV